MNDYTNYEVCVDCYYAHHGLDEDDTHTPDQTPLGKIRKGVDISDNTNSETGEGLTEFTWRRCEGCGSTLGGARYRLAVWDRFADLTLASHGNGYWSYWTTADAVHAGDTVRGVQGRQLSGPPARILSTRTLPNGRISVTYRYVGAANHATRSYTPDHPLTIVTRTAPPTP